jgi:hypothetical protein
LIGYIWHQLFKIVENNNSIKHCLYCKEVFIIGSGSARSDKVYCSNSCVVNGSRTEAIFKKYEKDFQKKGYLIRKSGGNTENQFDYWLINKENVLIAGLDIAQSQISEFSQKWGHQCKMIETKLNANNLSIAFLINKEGRKYSFSNLSTIMGSFIENIPDISFWDEHLKMFSVLSKYKKDLEEQKKVSMELQKIKESFFSDLQEDLTIPELKDDIKNNKEVA